MTIDKILEEYGYKTFEEADAAEHWSIDSVVPGCCKSCGVVEFSCEPDAEDNYCEECGENQVISIVMLVLNGI